MTRMIILQVSAHAWRKAGSGWMSNDAKHELVNMRGKKQDLIEFFEQAGKVSDVRAPAVR